MTSIAPRPPRPFWRWLVLVTPSVQLILIAQWQWPLARLLFRRDDLPNITVLFHSLLVTLLLSFALGFWEAWRFKNVGKRLGMGIVFGLGIAIVNLSIGWVGCAVTGGFK